MLVCLVTRENARNWICAEIFSMLVFLYSAMKIIAKSHSLVHYKLQIFLSLCQTFGSDLQAEGSSAESIAALAKVDTVKQRMEAAYETLQVGIFVGLINFAHVWIMCLGQEL